MIGISSWSPNGVYFFRFSRDLLYGEPDLWEFAVSLTSLSDNTALEYKGTEILSLDLEKGYAFLNESRILYTWGHFWVLEMIHQD